MASRSSFATLDAWLDGVLAGAPDDAGAVRLRAPESDPPLSVTVDWSGDDAGAVRVALADWARDNAPPPCKLRCEWLDGSGGYLSGRQRTFASDGDPDDGDPSPVGAGAGHGSGGLVPSPVGGQLASPVRRVVDVDGFQLPAVAAPPMLPELSPAAAQAAVDAVASGDPRGLVMLAAGLLSVAQRERSDAAHMMATAHAAALQSAAESRQLARDAVAHAGAMATALRQARGIGDQLAGELVGIALAQERANGDTRAELAAAQVRAALPAGESADVDGATGGDMGAAIELVRELRGAAAEVRSQVDARTLGSDGPELGAVRDAMDGKPERLAAWAAGLSPERRAAFVGKLAPLMSVLA